MKQQGKQRDYTIDMLRFIAIVCIILAHAEPPRILLEIRNFDVILIVLVGGMTFYISSADKEIKYLEYLKKRFKRLIIPTWIFLTIFFAFFFLLGTITKGSYPFNLKTLIGSYGLIGGIGYVWIMRVFFLVAIISPWVLKISKSIKSNTVYFVGLLGVYSIYILVVFISFKMPLIIKILIENSIIHMLGWGIIAAIGIRIKQLNKKELKVYTLIFLGIYIVSLIFSGFSSTQGYKYPPTMYYMSYGIFMSLLLFQILRLKPVYKLFNNSFVKYIAANSLTLYFWHIIPIWLLKLYRDNLKIVDSNFITRFIFIVGIASILTVIQHKVTCRKAEG